MAMLFLMLTVGVNAGGRIIELKGNTPRFIFGQQETQLTLLYNTSESEKLTCSGEIEAKDLRIAGTTTTMSDLVAEVEELRSDKAANNAKIAKLEADMQLMFKTVGHMI